MYVVLRNCEADRQGPEVEYRRPHASVDDARELVGHWREVARAGGRGCCRYDLFRLAPEHVWPLLDLTADETAALGDLARRLIADAGWISPVLRSAMDKLTKENPHG